MKLQADTVNKSLHNIPITEELKALNVASLGSGWVKLHPESVDIPANTTSLQQLKPGLPPEIANNQNNVGHAWRIPTGVVLVMRKRNWLNPRWS